MSNKINKDLKYFILCKKNINNINFPSFFCNELVGLYIKNINLRNISFINKLPPTLEKLKIENTRNTDISLLSNLTKLETLEVTNCNIKNYSKITNLTNLDELIIKNTNICNLAFLSKLKKLKKVNLSYNEIYDISPLTKLPKLRHLNICGNNISDIEPLRNFNFSELYFFDNPCWERYKVLKKYSYYRKNYTVTDELNKNIIDVIRTSGKKGSKEAKKIVLKWEIA